MAKLTQAGIRSVDRNGASGADGGNAVTACNRPEASAVCPLLGGDLRHRKRPITSKESNINLHSCRLPSVAALFGIPLVLAANSAMAQLPAPTQTVYKCTIGGKIRYSDEPCLGAKRIDVTPTRGVDRLSGAARIGKDAARERRSEQFARAVEPITGMNEAEFATAARRARLGAESQRECRQLEAAIVASEKAERSGFEPAIQSTQQELFRLRKRYKTLAC